MAAPTLHIANKNYSSWSLRPWVLLTALDIDFVESLHRFGGPTPFSSFSPSSTVPCLVDGGTRVWDSLAIAEYVAETHPQVWPADRAARAWARSAASEMHSGFFALREQCSMSCGIRVRLHRVDAALAKDLARLDALWVEGLSRFGGPFLAGPTFTAADAFYAPVAFRIQTYGLELSEPAMAYAERMGQLPAMVDWYQAGIAETWRDAGHDPLVARWGEVVQDLRAG